MFLGGVIMCEFCVQHGEGKIWYQNAKNYAEELLTEERKQYMTAFWEKIEENAGAGTGGGEIDRLATTDPAAAKALILRGQEMAKQSHWGQVLPIEDTQKILETAVSVTRFPCVCRSTIHGIYDARFCFGFTTFKSDFWPKGMFEQWPDYSSELEVLTKEEAAKEFRKYDHGGLVHTVWTHGTPFISAMCNCTPRDCLWWRGYEKTGTRTLFKGEYVATIDIEECNGCRDCLKMCPFGAVKYSVTLEKCFVDQSRCFGCGLCRVPCSREAISLPDRNRFPVLAKEW
jgi:NAD-dependent dihydropyrimidine dehydrogenase PreA subunit